MQGTLGQMVAHTHTPRAVQKISFVIPAHDEEPNIAGVVEAINRAMVDVARPYEVIVVADACTDRTADVARTAGARVVTVQHRHIAATRNSGAAVAEGDMLIFVDGDTWVSESAVRQAVTAIEEGAVGGGSRVEFDGEVPLWARTFIAVFILVYQGARWAAGCFVFCTRDAFNAIGGFDTTVYAAEEWYLSRALQRLGRMEIVPAFVITSGRKVRSHTPAQVFGFFVRAALSGPGLVRKKKGLDLWYGPRQHDVQRTDHGS